MRSQFPKQLFAYFVYHAAHFLAQDTHIYITLVNFTMLDSARDLIQNLNAAAAINFDGDDAARLELAMAARKLYHKLETNAEKVLRFINEEPVVYPAIQVLIDTGIWDAWTASGGGEKHIDEL